LPIVNLIVWANVDSVIEGVQNSLVKVIKVDQLTYFIDNYKEGQKLSEEDRIFAIRAIEKSAV